MNKISSSYRKQKTETTIFCRKVKEQPFENKKQGRLLHKFLIVHKLNIIFIFQTHLLVQLNLTTLGSQWTDCLLRPVMVYGLNSRLAIWTKRQNVCIPRLYSGFQYTGSSLLSGLSVSIRRPIKFDQKMLPKIVKWLFLSF